jgi:hypothetical protein
MDQKEQHANAQSDTTVVLPAPTAWPFVFALGIALMFAGLLTSASISVLGAVLYLAGGIGWFRQILPHEHEEVVPIAPVADRAAIPEREVMRLRVAQEGQRAWLPLKIYPVSAGVKGGMAGAVAMALLAMLYGVISHGSIWYPINLLAGSLYEQSAMPSMEEMLHFRLGWFLFGLALHATISLLVGLLYGAMLPMLPNRPILLGGVVAPLVWTGLVYHALGLVNPLLDQRINWIWFAASQVAFGVVAGLVVIRQSKVWTSQNLPFAVRAGIEAPGVSDRTDKDSRR